MPIHNYLGESAPPAWEFTLGDGDIVLKSAVYLARNFADYRFPHLASDDELKKIADTARDTVKNLDMEEIVIDRLTAVEGEILADKRIIAKCFLNGRKHRLLYLKNDGKTSVTVNEEDHILISCKREGLGFFEILDNAFKIDDMFDAETDIAYDETFGYLSSLPSRVGTGLRAVAILHLPALSYTKNIKNTADIAGKLGLDFISLYGAKEKDWQGNLFLLSNHKTIGFPEIDTVKKVENFAREVASTERRGREVLEKHRKDPLADVVWRAYGLLEHSKILTEKEALDAASKLQLGSDMGIIDKIPGNFFGEIFTLSRRSYLRNLAGSDGDIEHLRAIIANKTIKKYMK